ncbi:MAG: LysR family transcriptional regulator [Planktomarina sp.]
MSDMFNAEIKSGFDGQFAVPVVPAHLLICFNCVAEHRSVSHAATVLCLPYNVVAQQIARLEGLIGAPVLDQQPGRLNLTPVGQRLWQVTSPQASALQTQAHAVLSGDFAKGTDARRNGEPTLLIELGLWGMAASLKPYLNVLRGLPCNLNFVTKGARPGVAPDVICHLSKAPINGYESTPLFGEEVIAVASASYPTPEGGFTDETLKQEPLLRLGHLDHEEDWPAFLGLDPDVGLPGIEKQPYASFSHYLRALRAGRGVGVGLKALLQPEISAGTLKVVSPRKLWRNRACYLGVRKDSDYLNLARDFADVMRTIFEDNQA